jgi:hypothetical protein
MSHLCLAQNPILIKLWVAYAFWLSYTILFLTNLQFLMWYPLARLLDNLFNTFPE